jgi:hypothetical protein
MNRDTSLLNLRPEIPSIEEGKEATAPEQFQNNTLRPILKLQHPLLWQVFLHYTQKRKGVFDSLDLKEKLTYIEQSVRKDLRFKSQLLGLVIGHFTGMEWKKYIEQEAEHSRRLTDLIIQRLQSEVERI